MEAESQRQRDLPRYRRSIKKSSAPLYIKETIVGRYPRYNEMLVWMSRVANHHPDIATVVDIGYSFEGRKLRVLKIGSRSNVEKPAIWIDGGIHGREWIAPATAIFIIDQLVSTYGKLNDHTVLVDVFDWYIMPVVNPDGYEFSHSSNRIWRKTRSRTPGISCTGVDANRNFGYKWKECDKRRRGSRHTCYSDDPCESIYAGLHPFSENETVAMSNFLLSKKRNLKIFFSLHCYSQLWLTPWAYTKSPPYDYTRLEEVAMVGINAIKVKNNRTYRVGSPANMLYTAGGSALDWAKGELGVKYVYTLELPDRGKLGFLLPVQAIKPIADETFAGIKAVASTTTPEFSNERNSGHGHVDNSDPSNLNKVELVLQDEPPNTNMRYLEPQTNNDVGPQVDRNEASVIDSWLTDESINKNLQSDAQEINELDDRFHTDHRTDGGPLSARLDRIFNNVHGPPVIVSDGADVLPYSDRSNIVHNVMNDLNMRENRFTSINRNRHAGDTAEINNPVIHDSHQRVPASSVTNREKSVVTAAPTHPSLTDIIHYRT